MEAPISIKMLLNIFLFLLRNKISFTIRFAIAILKKAHARRTFTPNAIFGLYFLLFHEALKSYLFQNKELETKRERIRKNSKRNKEIKMELKI